MDRTFYLIIILFSLSLPVLSQDMTGRYEDNTSMNILGNDAGEVDEAAIHYFRDTENCYVHWYGKSDIKPERKMGHITCVGSSLQALKIVCDK